MNFNICSVAIIILISSIFIMFFRDEDLFNKFMIHLMKNNNNYTTKL